MKDNQIEAIGKLLAGKKGLITGVANNLSIAWRIAEVAAEHGAEIALSYQDELLLSRVSELATKIGAKHLYQCNVADGESIDQLFTNIKNDMGSIDFIIHALAFSDKAELRGKYLNTSLSNFITAMNISCYSLTHMCRAAYDMMNPGGSIITLTYYGSVKVMPSYNVMGVAKAALEASVRYLAVDMGDKNVRVNAISAGPIRTLASSAIADFRTMLDTQAAVAPLKRNVSQNDVAKSALYLLSDLSSGVTGEIHYVDCGYNVMGFFSNNA